MRNTKLNERFFDSTRGRIISLLRDSTATVNDLSEHLGLTDNAVRAHLSTLERDGLVRQSGLRKGSRKPHYAYELTSEGEHLFPKAYDALLNQFISVLKERLTARAFKDSLRAVGRALALNRKSSERRQSLERRAQDALRTLKDIGGNPRLEKHRGTLVISSGSCPLAAVVAEHPETCQMVETLISDLVESEVKEDCDRSSTPRCRFTISA
jgi:predicted ArsR family transcriptional regulator